MRGAALAVAEARDLLLAEVATTAAEPVPLAECLGRALATPAIADAPLPGFDNSAMDGFAVRAADAVVGSPRLRIVGESRAGRPAAIAVGPGEAVRISTGAMMPAGADSVVPVEEAREEGEDLHPTAPPVTPGAHVRRAGEDVEVGAEVVPAGREIGPAELAMLASLGLPAVECARRPRVAVLSGGDELLVPGEPPALGRIYDSNRFALVAMASRAGAEASFEGVMADELDRTREAIAAALESDLVVLTGGVSVGRHDHVKEALAELGVEQLFWRVALRPGGPTWGGVLRRPGAPPTVVLGLPGNPVSAQITFRLFAHPAILAATGRDPDERRLSAALAEAYAKRGGHDRAHYLRCRLEPGGECWRAHLTRERQQSHVQSSMLGADGLAVIPADRDQLGAGEAVEVLLL